MVVDAAKHAQGYRGRGVRTRGYTVLSESQSCLGIKCGAIWAAVSCTFPA
jgi:hypothetical protein